MTVKLQKVRQSQEYTVVRSGEDPDQCDDRTEQRHQEVSRPMQTYARARGKRIWCEKSLDSVGAAPLLAKVFPDARFICLYRHCLGNGT